MDAQTSQLMNYVDSKIGEVHEHLGGAAEILLEQGTKPSQKRRKRPKLSNNGESELSSKEKFDSEMI
jgi:hypothetical protein